MYFSIPNEVNYTIDQKKISIKRIAYTRAARYRMTPSSIKLDQYLQAEYKKSLKQLCAELIAYKIKINSSAADNRFIVTFVDSDSDRLASLITYGNGEINGCNILKAAFNQEY